MCIRDRLRTVTGYTAVEERIEQRTLRVAESSVDKLLPIIPDVSPAKLRTEPTQRTAAPSKPAPAPAPAPVATAPVQVTTSPTPSTGSGDVLDNLLQLIADKTGYDTSELEVDFELEADLGIDTVKQAEIFSDLSEQYGLCLLYTSPSPRDATLSRMPSSA